MDEEKTENSNNRFSDDGMETEIEVKQEDNPKPKRRQKKKGDGKKIDANGKEQVPDTPPPEYQSQVEGSDDDDESKEGKKATMKKNLKNCKTTPIVLAYALVVCVFLPMAIYACDVIISVNVLQRHNLWKTVFNDDMLESYALYPKPIEVTGNKYNNSDTMLYSFQENIEGGRTFIKELEASHRNKRQIVDAQPIDNITTTEIAEAQTTQEPTTADFAQATTQEAVVETTASAQTTKISGAEAIDTTTPTPVESTTPTPVESTTTTTTTSTTEKTTVSDEKFETTTVLETTSYDISGAKQKKGEFCKGLYHFYDIHISTYASDGSDWFENEVQSLRNKQQTLFFMFTVIGFIFLLAAIGIRSEMFLNDEWSSYIVFQFLLYAISMALTVAVFAQENASSGLRCFVCRLSNNCTDIDPFNLLTHWPKVPDNDTWSLVALVSLFLKGIDCFLIGTVTLKFIWNGCADPCWKIFLKLAGWMLFFPILIFTPMLGVVRYQVVPWVLTDYTNYEEIRITSEFFFYFGVALWAVTLTALPIFCKLRMCGKNRQDVEEEIEHEYYD